MSPTCFNPQGLFGTILHAAHLLQGGHGLFPAYRRVHALDFQAVLGVLAHGAVGEEGEVLEDHAELAQSELAERRLIQGGDVLAVDEDAPLGGFDEPVEAAHQGGFAAAGESHDHDDLAFVDLEGGLGHAHAAAGGGEDFLLAVPLVQHGQGFVLASSKDLGDIMDADFFFHDLLPDADHFL